MMNGNKTNMKDEGGPVEAYSDADYATSKTDRRSVRSGVLMVGGMVVGWLCKKQECVALSTMEADFVAASPTAAEMMGIMELLKEIVVPPFCQAPFYMSTIKQQSLRSRARTR